MFVGGKVRRRDDQRKDKVEFRGEIPRKRLDARKRAGDDQRGERQLRRLVLKINADRVAARFRRDGRPTAERGERRAQKRIRVHVSAFGKFQRRQRGGGARSERDDAEELAVHADDAPRARQLVGSGGGKRRRRVAAPGRPLAAEKTPRGNGGADELRAGKRRRKSALRPHAADVDFRAERRFRDARADAQRAGPVQLKRHGPRDGERLRHGEFQRDGKALGEYGGEVRFDDVFQHGSKRKGFTPPGAELFPFRKQFAPGGVKAALTRPPRTSARRCAFRSRRP